MFVMAGKSQIERLKTENIICIGWKKEVLPPFMYIRAIIVIEKN
jgi:hypothetical protein